MIKDRFARATDILRISVTQNCNLSCPYCHREGECAPCDEMKVSEIERIVRTCARLGVTKVKITGGEPLLRKDIVDVVRQVAGVHGIEEVSMTTNGTMLAGMGSALLDAGLMRVNIGCDSHSSSVLEKTAEKIRPNINELKKAGLDGIKLNMVVLAGVNDDDIEGMIKFSGKMGVTLQLIELLLTKDNSDFYSKHFYSLEDVEHELEVRASSVEIRKMHNRRRFHVDGGVIEVVRPHKNGFCENCRTLRVTSDGKIKPCLMRDDNLLDVLSRMRKGVSDDELKGLILSGIDRREPYVSNGLKVRVSK